MHRISAALFIVVLALLPAAEWRSIILPISGKPIGFDPAGQASASPFDLVFLLFCISLVPAGIRFVRERFARSPALVHWWVALALLALMLATNEHIYPFLTPVVRKVVDSRSLLIHFAVMVGVAVYVVGLRVETVIRGMFAFCAVAAAALAVLSYLALTEFPYFRLYYPFQIPTHIAFPFPNYNVAAPFITVTCLGFVACAAYLRRPLAMALGVPAFVLAATLTGSRSNLLMLVGALVVLACGLTFVASSQPRKVLAGRAAAWVSSVAALTLGIALAAGHWQPVQRALSIFGDVVSDPAVLVRGQEGSPRKVMWDLARSRADLSSLDDNRNYDLILTAIRGGCVVNSEPIKNLSAGRDYWVRLIQDFSPGASHPRLEVYADQERRELVDATKLSRVGLGSLPHLYLYLADSGPRYVIQSGFVGEFRLSADGKGLPPEALMPPKGLSYFDPLNGSPGSPVVARGDRIVVDAKDRRIRGFVAPAQKVPEARERLVLEYRLRLERVTFTLPLDAPVMFYVGLHDSAVTAKGDGWTEIRNGLLVQHRRQSSPWEMGLFAHADVERIWEEYPYSTPQERRAHYERLIRERRCGLSGAQSVRRLWTALDTYDSGNLNFADIFASNIPGRFGRRTGSDLSLQTDETWSSERHLKYGGSTHNLYLDWYYYEGTAALALWLLFAASFLVSLALAVWRMRSSRQAGFLFAVALQVSVIFALMYAQPYVWIKYFWVLFGIASALLVHEDLTGAAAARRAS